MLSAILSVSFCMQEKRWLFPFPSSSPSLSSCCYWPTKSQRRHSASQSLSTTSCSPWSWSPFQSSWVWSCSTCTTEHPAHTSCQTGFEKYGAAFLKYYRTFVKIHVCQIQLKFSGVHSHPPQIYRHDETKPRGTYAGGRVFWREHAHPGIQWATAWRRVLLSEDQSWSCITLERKVRTVTNKESTRDMTL